MIHSRVVAFQGLMGLASLFSCCWKKFSEKKGRAAAVINAATVMKRCSGWRAAR